MAEIELRVLNTRSVNVATDPSLAYQWNGVDFLHYGFLTKTTERPINSDTYNVHKNAGVDADTYITDLGYYGIENQRLRFVNHDTGNNNTNDDYFFSNAQSYLFGYYTRLLRWGLYKTGTVEALTGWSESIPVITDVTGTSFKLNGVLYYKSTYQDIYIIKRTAQYINCEEIPVTNGATNFIPDNDSRIYFDSRYTNNKKAVIYTSTALQHKKYDDPLWTTTSSSLLWTDLLQHYFTERTRVQNNSFAAMPAGEAHASDGHAHFYYYNSYTGGYRYEIQAKIWEYNKINESSYILSATSGYDVRTGGGIKIQGSTLAYSYVYFATTAEITSRPGILPQRKVSCFYQYGPSAQNYNPPNEYDYAFGTNVGASTLYLILPVNFYYDYNGTAVATDISINFISSDTAYLPLLISYDD